MLCLESEISNTNTGREFTVKRPTSSQAYTSTDSTAELVISPAQSYIEASDASAFCTISFHKQPPRTQLQIPSETLLTTASVNES